ncbi:uncharacterized protein KY384_008658 [Bacidia gigantensis]|uniref:uncharacterized protein n=1 Tax=Bacidia gigantensis TaxID=2732470 RepID=UPI001D047DA0|nr:uncharacterized protein KY384_008658 [Bacidia gigantensis]KAG8527228.1 hypothetical protein KY384_008658 [Bacidia gigantensis]
MIASTIPVEEERIQRVAPHIAHPDLLQGSTVIRIGNESSLQFPDPKPPGDFRTSCFYDPGARPLNSFRRYIAIITCAVQEADKDWNLREMRVDCDGTEDIHLRLIGNPRPGDPPLLVKHVMWSIIAVPHLWQRQGFAEIQFRPILAGQILGLGKVFRVGARSEDDNISWGSTSPQMTYNESAGTQTYRSQSLAPGNRDFYLQVHPSLSDRVLCTAAVFYNQLTSMIMHLAVMDRDSLISEIQVYDQEHDITFEMSAARGIALEDFPQRAVLQAIEALANYEADVRADWRFRPFTGTVSVDRRVVGTTALFEGVRPHE